jgi:ankyrin repeat protein
LVASTVGDRAKIAKGICVTPLHYACDSGQTAIAVAFIERGANVSEKNLVGQTPLHWACSSGHTAKAVALIERGASVNEKSQYGDTPLHIMHVSIIILP